MNRLAIISSALVLIACTATVNKNEESIADGANNETISTPGEPAAEVIQAVELPETAEFMLPDIFDFSICNDQTELEERLGRNARFEVREFEGGDDYDAYSLCSFKFEDSEGEEYSYGGMHRAIIQSPLLPLKNGIQIGMSKSDFLKKFGMEDREENEFEMKDDYGSAGFTFLDGILVLVTFHYEYGT